MTFQQNRVFVVRAIVRVVMESICVLAVLLVTATEFDESELIAWPLIVGCLIAVETAVILSGAVNGQTRDGRARPFVAIGVLLALIVGVLCFESAAYAVWRPVTLTATEGPGRLEVQRRPWETRTEHVDRFVQEVLAGE